MSNIVDKNLYPGSPIDPRALLRELKELWFSKSARSELWKFWDKVSGILQDGKSPLRRVLLDKVSQPDEYQKLIEYTSQIELYDIEKICDILSSFIQSNYNLDLVIYKLNTKKNTLDFFSWNQKIASHISLYSDEENGASKTSFYTNEQKALQAPFQSFLLTLDQKENDSIANIKMCIWDEIFIFSFHKKDILTLSDEQLSKDIYKVEQLFTQPSFGVWLNEKYKYISAKYVDSLTGLFKKDYIYALPKHVRYSVLFIDLNKFKSINDTYGHHAWDIVLQKFAQTLQKSVRKVDKVCRYAGDEFVILVPSNRVEDLDCIVDRLVYELENLEISFPSLKHWEKHTIKVGASIGKAIASPGRMIDEIIKEADQNMYEQKTISGTIERHVSELSEKFSPQQLHTLIEALKKQMNITLSE